MAVSQMQRVQIFAHNSHRALLIKDLQEMEIIHINNLTEELTDELPTDTEIRENIRSLQNNLSILESTISYLANFEPKKGFLAGLSGGRMILSPQEYDSISQELSRGEWRDICHESQSLEEGTSQLNSLEGKLNNEKQHILPWTKLDAPIEEIKDTEKVAIRIGTVPESTFNMLSMELRGPELNVAFENIGTTKNEVNVFITFLLEDEQKVSPILTKYGFSQVSLPIPSGKVVDRIKAIDKEISEIAIKREEIAKKSSQLAIHRQKLMSLYDYMKDLLEREEVRQSFIHTDQAFMVDGWVLKQDVQKLKDKITSKYNEVEIIASDPTDEDDPPIYLQNRGLASPFRMVTGLYGLPSYRGIDPSPLFAPFFTISLALTISDAGYGLIVALLGYFLSKRSKGSSKDLFRIFIIAGCTAILIGLFTGGWFGIKAEKLPSLLRKFQLYDPMSTTGQLIFMGIVIGIGFIQVWFGNLIKMRLYIKGRDWAGAFLEQLPWLLAMVIAPVAGYLYVTKVSPGLTTAVIWIIVICLIIMTLFTGRSIKNPVGRLAQGLFDLYGRLSGLLGDTLSYMRLFALGLSGVIFAGVVNTMAGILWGNLIGKIAVIGLLLGGHGFSVLMGCLGGFIHTTRLQFVEFFTKFYESGGREFRPFKSEYAYIAVDMKKSTKK